MRVRFTLSRLMILIALLGLGLGVLPHDLPHLIDVLMLLVLPAPFLAGVGYAIYRVSRLRLRYRLPIELATLIGLLWLSAEARRPYWHASEEHRCRRLAARAHAASARNRETRSALDREAAWFTRQAANLYWRGFRLGLTQGPRANEAEIRRETRFIYDLDAAESMRRHEATLRGLLGTGPDPEE
ncbi:hypothetical protein OJF2_36520 [Aquisphaera giovannonii]|uniref:Uncharacterized protein n=1 Tax=Aquisphaera giovannonii TaxID=406548 RepID=A0A5B9W4F8_9BACT|nr:hypothetical protein [Aquisphaera giovannonii]QEH35107.1 hypothetical protein OJF2_36520 [Aquisphaera giovannonii]